MEPGSGEAEGLPRPDPSALGWSPKQRTNRSLSAGPLLRNTTEGFSLTTKLPCAKSLLSPSSKGPLPQGPDINLSFEDNLKRLEEDMSKLDALLESNHLETQLSEEMAECGRADLFFSKAMAQVMLWRLHYNYKVPLEASPSQPTSVSGSKAPEKAFLLEACVHFQMVSHTGREERD